MKGWSVRWGLIETFTRAVEVGDGLFSHAQRLYCAEVPDRHIDHRCTLDSAHGNLRPASCCGKVYLPSQPTRQPGPKSPTQLAGPAVYRCSPDGFPLTWQFRVHCRKSALRGGDHVRQRSFPNPSWPCCTLPKHMAMAPVRRPRIARSLDCLPACLLLGAYPSGIELQREQRNAVRVRDHESEAIESPRH